MNSTANSSYGSFFCVQNTTLLRCETFNTGLAIRQCRKKRFLSLRKLNIKRIFLETMQLMLPNDINLSRAKKCIKFINSQIARTGRQATPN